MTKFTMGRVRSALRRDYHPVSRSAYDLLPGPRHVECDGPKLNFHAHIGG